MPNTTLETAELAVVFFKLIEGNFDHWALWLHGSEVDKLFQVAGDYAEMEAQALDEDPRDNSRLYQRIAVGHVLAADLEALETCVGTVPVQNDVALWDCQDYVLDVLDALEREGFVGVDRGYARLRRRLSTLRGPADETRHLVEQWNFCGRAAVDQSEESSLQLRLSDSDDELSVDPQKQCLSAEFVVDSDDEC